MLREIRIDVVLLILITAAVTIFILNATTTVGPFATGQVGVPSGDAAAVEATVESTEEAVTEEPTAEATLESTEEAATEEPTAEATEE